MRQKTYTVQFRRKREGRTNYKKRLKLLLSNLPRLVIRKANKNISVQIVEYANQGDRVVLSAHSGELEKFGWALNKGNLPSAYLTGLLAGQKAMEKNIKKAVLDIGLGSSTKGNRIYAALKGVVDSGIEVPHDAGVLPSDERIKGQHISSFIKSAKTQFSEYKQKSISADSIPKIFEEVKKKIIERKNERRKQ